MLQRAGWYFSSLIRWLQEVVSRIIRGRFSLWRPVQNVNLAWFKKQKSKRCIRDKGMTTFLALGLLHKRSGLLSLAWNHTIMSFMEEILATVHKLRSTREYHNMNTRSVAIQIWRSLLLFNVNTRNLAMQRGNNFVLFNANIRNVVMRIWGRLSPHNTKIRIVANQIWSRFSWIIWKPEMSL